ncbi:hypothetical protein FACS1894170_11090 [Planctomycetales bacterium]|nr:hypothetical protein FACS1894170_11090 [Planctomycetales bacterium]
MNETVLMRQGMDTLITHLGYVEAERFISILLREPFDYTEWRKKGLQTDKSIEEMSREAMAEHQQEWQQNTT